MSNEKANDASDGSSKAVKGDIVRIEFDGYTEDSKELFDTTSAQVAKDNGVFNEKATYTVRASADRRRQDIPGAR